MASIAFTSDKPSKVDALKRQGFANSLANALVHYSGAEGVVVGIEGGWGTGKSSLIEFVKERLEQISISGSPPLIIDFSPWMISNTGTVVDTLLTQIAAKISLTSTSIRDGVDASQKLLNYLGLLKHLKHLRFLKYVPMTGWVGTLAEDTAGFIETASAGVSETATSLEELKKALPTLDISARRKEVTDALQKYDKSIIVIIDDLDRLPPEEIRTIIQVVKAVVDFPRITYLLAYDREIVASALGNGSQNAGNRYLEKIVQIAYPIPPLFASQIHKFSSGKFKEFCSALSVNLRPFEEARLEPGLKIVSRLCRQPRDVVRLMNKLILSVPASEGAINVVDILVFEALCQRYPAIRESIHRHPAAFIGRTFRTDSLLKSDDELLEEGFESVRNSESNLMEAFLPEPKEDRNRANMACTFLFYYNSSSDRPPVEELRLADPDCLARFFSMTSLEEIPDITDIHRLLREPEKIYSEVSSHLRQDDLQFWLEWVESFIPSAQDIKSEACIGEFISAGRDLQSRRILKKNLALSLGSIILALLQRIEITKRPKIIHQIIRHAPLSISAVPLLEATLQFKKIPSTEFARRTQKDFIKDEQSLQNLSDAFRICFNTALENRGLEMESRLHSIFYIIAQLDNGYKNMFDAARKLWQTRGGLIAFLSEYSEHTVNEIDDLQFIDDVSVLVKSIQEASLDHEYAWLINLINRDGVAEGVKSRAELRYKLN